MPTANYSIIKDAQTKLSENALFADQRLIEFPDVTVPGADLGQRPVLTYQFSVIGDAEFLISLNRQEVVSASYDNADIGLRMMSEVVNHGILRANGNELIVSMSGPGVVTVSDLILWYRK